MNVLLTCAGRRNYLVQYFHAAVAPSGRVYAADSKATAAAFAEADAAFVLPPFSDPAYIPCLLAVCHEWQVKLLVPLHDYEIRLLAKHREQFVAVGTLPIVSASSIVETCLDKWAAHIFLNEHGIATPRMYRSLDQAVSALERGEVEFPLAVKPRWGSGSVGIEKVHDPDELELAYSLAVRRSIRLPPPGVVAGCPEDTLLIQEWLHGEEIGLDVINDLAGRYVCTFARHKLGMRSGETDCATTLRDGQFAELGRRLSEAVGHIGNLDCDVVVRHGSAHVLEMNPRFGGGYPFVHTAGANLPAALIAWAGGIQPDPAWFVTKPGVTMTKCDRIVHQVAGRQQVAPWPRTPPSAARPSQGPHPLAHMPW